MQYLWTCTALIALVAMNSASSQIMHSQPLGLLRKHSYGGMGGFHGYGYGAGFSRYGGMHTKPMMGGGLMPRYGGIIGGMHTRPMMGGGLMPRYGGMHTRPMLGGGFMPRYGGMHTRPMLGGGLMPRYGGMYTRPMMGGGFMPRYGGMNTRPMMMGGGSMGHYAWRRPGMHGHFGGMGFRPIGGGMYGGYHGRSFGYPRNRFGMRPRWGYGRDHFVQMMPYGGGRF